MFGVLSVLRIIIGGLKGNLGVPRQVVWVIYLCLTQVNIRIAFSEKVACLKRAQQ